MCGENSNLNGHLVKLSTFVIFKVTERVAPADAEPCLFRFTLPAQIPHRCVLQPDWLVAVVRRASGPPDF